MLVEGSESRPGTRSVPLIKGSGSKTYAEKVIGTITNCRHILDLYKKKLRLRNENHERLSRLIRHKKTARKLDLNVRDWCSRQRDRQERQVRE